MSIINTALTGALAAQAGVNTTSQNVANVMTPGYTRQGVLLSSVYLNAGNRINPGSGVAVPSLIRFSDAYKSQQMWQAASNLGQYDTAQPYLTQLEQVMGDDTTNINSGMDIFFGALNAASVEPASKPLRDQVITTAGALAQRFNNLRQLLSTQRQSVDMQRSAIIDQINELTPDIAALNQKISTVGATGTIPSGLVDERDQKIDKLASLVGLQVVDQPDGSRNVSLRSGQPLVVGTMASTMKIDPSGRLTLTFGLESFALDDTAMGGQLGGLYDYTNNTLTPQTQSIVEMAQGLSKMINDQLGAGYAMDGTSGQPLFDFDPTSASAMLTTHPGIVSQDLAFSSDPTLPGDSGNLLAVIGLKDQPVSISLLGSGSLLGDAYTQLVGKLGTDSQQNQASLTMAQTVRDQAEESWKSSSGVNSDEEAVNLVQYQQMYQANMKVVAVANQLFDATLAMFG
jgi:flagellar hook-associated protein 1 FlgK